MTPLRSREHTPARRRPSLTTIPAFTVLGLATIAFVIAIGCASILAAHTHRVDSLLSHYSALVATLEKSATVMATRATVAEQQSVETLTLLRNLTTRIIELDTLDRQLTHLQQQNTELTMLLVDTIAQARALAFRSTPEQVRRAAQVAGNNTRPRNPDGFRSVPPDTSPVETTALEPDLVAAAEALPKPPRHSLAALDEIMQGMPDLAEEPAGEPSSS